MRGLTFRSFFVESPATKLREVMRNLFGLILFAFVDHPASFDCNQMAEGSTENDPTASTPRDLDYEQAQLAYSIIQSLLEHTRVVSDLIALMAQTLDEDTTKALTQTPVWTAYLDSRRALERTRTDVERFVEAMKRLSDE
jgi:hypothetical protein